MSPASFAPPLHHAAAGAVVVWVGLTAPVSSVLSPPRRGGGAGGVGKPNHPHASSVPITTSRCKGRVGWVGLFAPYPSSLVLSLLPSSRWGYRVMAVVVVRVGPVGDSGEGGQPERSGRGGGEGVQPLVVPYQHLDGHPTGGLHPHPDPRPRPNPRPPPLFVLPSLRLVSPVLEPYLHLQLNRSFKFYLQNVEC